MEQWEEMELELLEEEEMDQSSIGETTQVDCLDNIWSTTLLHELLPLEMRCTRAFQILSKLFLGHHRSKNLLDLLGI